MELEEAIKRLSMKAITSSTDAPDYPNCIVMKKDLITVLNHLTKQEKMIDLMGEELAFGVFDFKNKKQAKQYFEKKTKESE